MFRFSILRLAALFSIFGFAYCEGPYTPAENAAFYPANTLNNPGALFPLGGAIPSSRVHHSISATSEYVLVYGGYAEDASFLGDINVFYIPSQQWSGPIVRKQCCNSADEMVETIGADTAEGVNFDVDNNIRTMRTGFQGDTPLPRAEHAVCTIAEQMYVFGGVTELYNYVNDVYRFDPQEVRWEVQDASNGDSFPRRRAGHSMVCDPAHRAFYIFGGRSRFGSTDNVGLNDLWRYDTVHRTWTLLTRVANGVQGSVPSVRQYASTILLNGNIYLFGGVDPATGMVHSDVWVFRIAIQSWEMLYNRRLGHAHTEGVYQFAPPGLYHAHLLPIPESLDPYTAINTTTYGSDTDLTYQQNGGFLVYGGVGGGGSCGTSDCDALETTLGQVYKFSLAEGRWTSPHTITGAVANTAVNDIYSELQYTQDSAWQYARISSAAVPSAGTTNAQQSGTTPPSTSSTTDDTWVDRGKWIKTFALEKVVFVPARNLMYEMGGLVARKANKTRAQNDAFLHGAGANSGADNSVLIAQAQSSSITVEDVLAQGSDVNTDSSLNTLENSGDNAIFLDAASGQIANALWDRHIGEQLRQVVDLPINGFWDYTAAFTGGINAASPLSEASKPIRMMRSFRTYTISPSDIVMVKEDTFVESV